MKNTKTNSLLSEEVKTALIKSLIEHVTDELTPTDVEQRFDDMLDEIYSFEQVGGPFAHMIPSRVLQEVDPTAYRCGIADMDMSDDHFEINDEHYPQDDVNEARESFIADLRDSLKEVENDMAELEADTNEKNEKANKADIALFEIARAEIEAKIDLVESHVF